MIEEFDERPVAPQTEGAKTFELSYRKRHADRIQSDLLSTDGASLVTVKVSGLRGDRVAHGSLVVRTEFLSDDGQWHRLSDLYEPIGGGKYAETEASVLLPHWRVRLVVEAFGAERSLADLHAQTFIVTRNE